MAIGTVTVICYPGGSGGDLRDAFGGRLARPGLLSVARETSHCAALRRLLPDKRSWRSEVYHRLGSFTVAGLCSAVCWCAHHFSPVSAYP